MKRHVLLRCSYCRNSTVERIAPKGWKMRVDRSMAASDPDAAGDIKSWKWRRLPRDKPQGGCLLESGEYGERNYTLKGTFKLIKTMGHAEYTACFGGSDLEGRAVLHLFHVEQGGTWLVKSRSGSSTAQIASSGGPSDAVKAGDMSSNALEVHVLGDKIEFLVNGKVVNTTRSPDKHPRPTASMAFALIICRGADRWIRVSKSSLSGRRN